MGFEIEVFWNGYEQKPKAISDVIEYIEHDILKYSQKGDKFEIIIKVI